ncbi:hypothetical protein Tco_0548581 [Tanacetum coccineum]
MEEVLLPQAHHEFLLWEGCNRDAKSRMGYDGEIDDMLRISFADDELQTKKIIKFRLGGRAHSLTLLEFAQRLGLYQAVELEEGGDCKMDDGRKGKELALIILSSTHLYTTVSTAVSTTAGWMME